MAQDNDFAGGTNTFGGFNWPRRPSPQLMLQFDDALAGAWDDDEPIACGPDSVDVCEACD